MTQFFFSHESSSWVEIRLHTEFGCVGAEKKWDTVVVLHSKIRPTQLWIELSWVVAIYIFIVIFCSII